MKLRVCFMLRDGTMEWTRGGTATKLDFRKIVPRDAWIPNKYTFKRVTPGPVVKPQFTPQPSSSHHRPEEPDICLFPEVSWRLEHTGKLVSPVDGGTSSFHGAACASNVELHRKRLSPTSCGSFRR